MNIIDVTLRDGGHQVAFDWNDSFLKKYIPAVSRIAEVKYIELGYWGQTAKSTNRFYNMNFHDLECIASFGLEKEISIMIDYHYCSKNLSDYKNKVFQDRVGLIRLCSRREDIKDAVKFGRTLVEELGVKLSLNFFNITNYSKSEIELCIRNGKLAGASFIYFADTHGALDLYKDGDTYRDYASMVSSENMVPGLHLHDHSGKAYLNYCLGRDLGFGSFDCSLAGMGKGAGNLKMEHIVSIENNLEIIDLLATEVTLRMPPLITALITANLSATDYYANYAENNGLLPSELALALKEMDSTGRDIFSEQLIVRHAK